MRHFEARRWVGMLLGLGCPALFPQVCEQTREAALYFTLGNDLPVKGRFDREARVIPLVPACLYCRNFGWRGRRHQKRAVSKRNLRVKAEGKIEPLGRRKRSAKNPASFAAGVCARLINTLPALVRAAPGRFFLLPPH